MTLRDDEVAAGFFGVLVMVRHPELGLRGSSAPLVFIQPGVDTLAQQVLSL